MISSQINLSYMYVKSFVQTYFHGLLFPYNNYIICFLFLIPNSFVYSNYVFFYNLEIIKDKTYYFLIHSLKDFA
jgi:hypothetical protein